MFNTARVELDCKSESSQQGRSCLHGARVWVLSTLSTVYRHLHPKSIKYFGDKSADQ